MKATATQVFAWRILWWFSFFRLGSSISGFICSKLNPGSETYIRIKSTTQSCMMAHISNSSTQEAKAREQHDKFELNLGYRGMMLPSNISSRYLHTTYMLKKNITAGARKWLCWSRACCVSVKTEFRSPIPTYKSWTHLCTLANRGQRQTNPWGSGLAALAQTLSLKNVGLQGDLMSEDSCNQTWQPEFDAQDLRDGQKDPAPRVVLWPLQRSWGHESLPCTHTSCSRIKDITAEWA